MKSSMFLSQNSEEKIHPIAEHIHRILLALAFTGILYLNVNSSFSHPTSTTPLEVPKTAQSIEPSKTFAKTLAHPAGSDVSEGEKSSGKRTLILSKK